MCCDVVWKKGSLEIGKKMRLILICGLGSFTLGKKGGDVGGKYGLRFSAL